MKLSLIELRELKQQFRQGIYKEQIEEANVLDSEITELKKDLKYLEQKYYAIMKPIKIAWQKELLNAEDAKDKQEADKVAKEWDNDPTDEWRDLQTNEM